MYVITSVWERERVKKSSWDFTHFSGVCVSLSFSLWLRTFLKICLCMLIWISVYTHLYTSVFVCVYARAYGRRPAVPSAHTQRRHFLVYRCRTLWCSRLLAGHFISILLAQWTLHLHCLDPLSARTARTEGAPGANTTRHIRFEPTAVSPPDISRPSAEPGETARGELWLH